MQMEIEIVIVIVIVIDIDSTLNCIRQCGTKRMWTDGRQLCAVGWMVFVIVIGIGIGIGICFFVFQRRVVSYVCVCVWAVKEKFRQKIQ